MSGNHASILKNTAQSLDGFFTKIAHSVDLRARVIQCVIIVIFLFYGLNNACADGLVAYWSFDDCTATDNSGNGHNGVKVGALQCVDGRMGKAFRFNGSTDWITVDSSDTFPSGSITISYWVNREGNSVTSLQNYLSKELAFQSYLYPDQKFTSGFWKGTPGDWSEYKSDNYTLHSLTSWINYIFTFDNETKTAKTYIDGVLDSSTIETDSNAFLRLSNEPLDIGRNGSMNVHHISGLFDEARIYNRVLTESEITDC